jgi:hypothetical protein
MGTQENDFGFIQARDTSHICSASSPVISVSKPAVLLGLFSVGLRLILFHAG